MQVGKTHTRFPRVGDHLAARHMERAVEVDISRVACPRKRLPFCEESFEAENPVLVPFEMTIDGDAPARMAQIQGPSVSPPLHLEAEHFSGRRGDRKSVV